MFEKVIHQIDSKNEWLVLLVTFTAKVELVFVLHSRTLFLRVVILKSTERPYVPLKNGTRDFQIALRLRDRHVFM